MNTFHENNLKTAIDMYKFEMDMYWKRATYFSILIGGLATGFYKLFIGVNFLYALLVAIVGVIVSFLWHLANKASKFWVSNWLFHSIQLESEVMGKKNTESIFNYYYVKDNDDFIKVKNIIYPGEAYPFSVSRLNHYLSFIVLFSWCVVLVVSLLKLWSLNLIINANDVWIMVSNKTLISLVSVLFMVIILFLILINGKMSDLNPTVKPEKYKEFSDDNK